MTGKPSVWANDTCPLFDSKEAHMERSKEEQVKEILDGHIGYSIADKIDGTSYNKDKRDGKGGSLIQNEPSSHGVDVKSYYQQKRLIEGECLAERKEKMGNLLMDCVDIRKSEILDKEDMPMPKLIELAIKSMPKQVEVKADVNIGLMSLYDDIDMEDD
jgi:hypothetical protein